MEKKYTLKELKTKYLVEIVEMDDFSGPFILEQELFDSKEDAEQFCKKYNSKNIAIPTPDYYTVANYRGKVI